MFLPPVAGALIRGKQVATKISYSALIASIRAVFSPVTDTAGINTEAVTTSPAFNVRHVIDAVTTGRVLTFLTVSVLRPLILYETLLVRGAVERFPPVPGTTAGLVVEVVVVTAVVRREDSFVISLRTVFLSVTHLQ